MGSPRGAGWLVGDGEIAELIRTKDWSQTALGSIETWPESLQTTISLSLASSFPINVIWGPGAVQIWNEAYSHVCGDKHPGEFGTDYRVSWASAWPAIGGAFETARGGETAFLENQPMFLDRKGYLEETWFTFSLSPIRDDRGDVVGLFHPVTETTPGMLSERRSRALRDLAGCAGRTRNVPQAIELSMEVLGNYDRDLPFVGLYLVDEDGRGARLAGLTGFEATQPILPRTLDLTDLSTVAGDVVRTGDARHIEGLGERLGPVRGGPHEEPVEQALLLPLQVPGDARPAGVLVAGVSTRLELDETYRAFFDLVAQGVTSALANALAYEQERARAEALADLDRAKTAFFSNVSHEFRTPLTLMLGPLEEELADTSGALSPASRERLTAAHRNSLRLLWLVNSLLDFSRLESGRVQARYLPTDLSAYTADLASLFRAAVEKAGLELVVDCEPLPEAVFVDRDMWEKVVLNLLSNAFKHTFSGAITVTLRWTGDGAELTVADTGIGIPEDELPRLFERFHRVRDAPSRTLEGSGIGLATVQELTRLHGGQVRISSEVGRGSSFVATVRAGRAHLPEDHVGDAAEAASTSVAASALVDEADGWLAGERPPAVADDSSATLDRVLVADDNADMRRHIARILEGRFDVVTAADGQEALEAALRDPPQLVLTDVMMPRLDGMGLLAALRADDRTREIPVIMLSARAGEEASVEGIEAGADDYLVKPFSSRELIARISGTLSLARLRQESATRLEEINRELEAASDAKGQFVANISHEIRTPLNAIIGMTSLLLETTLDETQDEFAQVIRSSGEHLLNLIGDVLDFSKIEAGAVKVERAPLNVRRCVQSAIDIATVDAAAKRLPLVAQVAPGVPEWVIGDSSRLSQILINLLGNAIKYTDVGHVTLSVSAVPTSPYLSELRFAIADTGIGIAEEDKAGLFDAFVQVEGKDGRSRPGAGLGLAISTRLAEVLGGMITVESALGEGSTFTLTLSSPLVDAPPAARPSTPVVGSDASGAGAPLRILIVDDNYANQRVTTLLLGQLGHAADTASDGIEAIRAIERQRYDLVFMDMQMPELSGLDATRIIRRRFPGARGPLIVGLSGYAFDDTRHECLAAGMNHYLVKPVTLAQFSETIDQLTTVSLGSNHEGNA